ncbi:MAG: helix-turn-helix transcriptional regulator, partial [Planctomyces sp.]
KKRRSSPATDIRQSTSGNTSRRRMPAAATPPNTSSPPPVAALRTQPQTEQPRWTFLTNHAHVLVLLWQNPAMIVREVARQVGITERAVQHILAELENAGILQRTRVGRQNRYHIETSVPLRHPIESHRTIGELLQLCARTQHT